MSKYDQVVVGAGIVGSWTALQLRKLGKKVLLVDQFGEPNSRGSSHGQSRIIRSSYAEKFFAEMMPHAFEMWRELERDTEKELILNCKFLAISDDPENEAYKGCIANLKSMSPEMLDEMKPGEINKRFSKTMKFSDSTVAFLDNSGGIMLAIQALLTVQNVYREKGGEMWENCEVYSVESTGDQVKIATQRGVVTAESVVICAGPWTQKLLTPHLVPSLPLEPVVVTVYYWKEKEKGAYSVNEAFPSFMDFCVPNVFALPSHEYPGLYKVCLHKGIPVDPDERDKAAVNKDFEKRIKNYIQEHLPLCESDEPSIIERCMYTMSPDEVFIVDVVPDHKNIFFGCGFSGTGFKTAPVIGRALSEMATGQTPFIDMTPFRLSRFGE